MYVRTIIGQVFKCLRQLLGYFSLTLGLSSHQDPWVTWLILLNSSIHSTDISEGQLWIRYCRISTNQTDGKPEPLTVLAEWPKPFKATFHVCSIQYTEALGGLIQICWGEQNYMEILYCEIHIWCNCFSEPQIYWCPMDWFTSIYA